MQHLSLFPREINRMKTLINETRHYLWGNRVYRTSSVETLWHKKFEAEVKLILSIPYQGFLKLERMFYIRS
jgi:hypothetical protein